MNNPFSQLGELKKMRDQALMIQRQLAAEEIEINKYGIKIIVTGDQKIKSIEAEGRSNNDIRDAVNEAMKKSQEMAAKKLQSMTGGMGGLGSLLGGK